MVNRRPEQTRARIAQTASRLRSLAHPAAVAPDELLVSEATGRIPLEEARRLRYRPAEIGETFGPQWATYWFRLAATVPEAWAGRPVELVWDSGCEATLYRGGEPVQGLVKGGGYDRTHRAARHAVRARGARARDGLQRPDGPARPVPAAPRSHRAHVAGAHRRPLAARAASARPPRPRRPRAARRRGVGHGVGPRGAAPALRGARAGPGLGGPAAGRARPLRAHVGRRRPRHAGPRRARSSATCSRTATPAARTT